MQIIYTHSANGYRFHDKAAAKKKKFLFSKFFRGATLFSRYSPLTLQEGIYVADSRIFRCIL